MSASKNLIQAAAGVGGGDFYPYTVDYSARFNQADDPYLYRTLSTTYSTYTFSAWVKLTALFVDYAYLFSSCSGGTQKGGVALNPSGNFYMFKYSGSASISTESAIRRDPSAWYHVVMKVSSGTASLHINGVQVLSGFSANSLQTGTNQTIVGAFNDGSLAYHWDGYISEAALVTGTAYDPTDFAEDKNGVWVPKDISGLTFGTDGFYLDFGNSAALGTDVSGNGNNFTSSGLTSSDQMTDTPTHNNVTWLPTYRFGGPGYNVSGTMSDGNLTASVNTSSQIAIASSVLPSTGKWYWEIEVDSVAAMGIGMTNTRYLNAISSNQTLHYNNGGSGNSVYIEGSLVTTYGTSWTTGDVIGVYFNADDGEISWYKNGTAMDSSPYSLSYSDGWIPYIAQLSGAGTCVGTLVTDENKFNHTPPTDALSLSAANFPEPTIGPNSDTLSDEYFGIQLYQAATTNGTYTYSDLEFQPDFTWIKCRDAGERHFLIDVLRGNVSVTDKYLVADSAVAEGVNSTSGTTFSVTSNGYEFVETSINTDELYFNNRNYVGWNWKAGGSGVSNTDGSITSTVSANQDSGFSIITYSGNSTAGATIGHGLTAAPEMVIVQTRSGTNNKNKPVYHVSVGATKAMILDVDVAETTWVGFWNNTVPTSSVITLGSDQNTNQTGSSYVAYAFHSVEGYSAFRKYIGNGSSDGPFVYTGFRPAFVMIKRTDSTGSWYIYDTERDPYNVMTEFLKADVTDAEGTSVGTWDYLSNGFKLRNSNAAVNGSGATYIYMAFAENPFKYSNAR